MVRKELREHIFKMLFQIEFNDPQEMPEQIEYYFSTLEDAADKDKEYIKRKYAAVLEKTEEIDECQCKGMEDDKNEQSRSVHSETCGI